MKKNLKKKISSYGFWISLLTVIFLIIQQILKNFGIELSSQLIIEIISGFCFILITIGVIKNSKKDNLEDIKEDVKSEIDKNSTKLNKE